MQITGTKGSLQIALIARVASYPSISGIMTSIEHDVDFMLTKYAHRVAPVYSLQYAVSSFFEHRAENQPVRSSVIRDERDGGTRLRVG